ncbi:TerB family tellurite resistance protein [Salipiger mucosus]|uniref:Co-chaperone DjlA N-terminal domain-containing protein n=1 Tax=Salipiger mucosus DSM 16094 TaxID=1123237 RepID=S9RCQ2_9RHOB|nr:TerB family tellurite resistance protein [Salipiger mucosus]EPX75910.1 hypothetical protein Salmuc_02306 [Salipiger mucosus DSM 16094]
MFERLTHLFHRRARPKAPLPPLDARHALGALLVKMALADRGYLFAEVAEIDRILRRAHGLKPLEAARMRAECEAIARAAPGIDEMARVIRETVDPAHRYEIVEALWQVALADGATDAQEAALADLVEDKLGLDREASETARAAAASIP